MAVAMVTFRANGDQAQGYLETGAWMPPDAAADAWRRTLAWFNRWLR